MEKIKYTIIIPNKNNKVLLDRLLDSIPMRDDIQIVIVDDNSDNMDFNDYPGQGRNNVIHIFTKEGKGAGYARNVGINYAIGDWILFADSDDFYVKGAFDILDTYTSNISYDVIYYNIESVNSLTFEKSDRNKNYSKYIKMYLDNKDPSGEYIRFRKWEPWNKLINRDFLIKNNIRCDEIPRCNDMMLSLLISYHAKSFLVISDKIYCVTYNPGSITRKKIKKDVFLNCVICEIKKNYLYGIIKHNSWKTRFIYITLYLLKNNGLIDTVAMYAYLFKNRDKLHNARLSCLKIFEKV